MSIELQMEYLPMQFPGRPDLRFEIAIDLRERDPIVDDVLGGHFYHELLVGLMLDLLEPGDGFIDLGANLGVFSLTAAAAGCRVLAVEANAAVAACLAESRRRNGFKQMEIENLAVSDKPGTVMFFPDKEWGRVLPEADGSARAVQVPATSVDALLAAHNWPSAKLVKMDVEGSEIAAVNGMRGLLTSAEPPILIYESNVATLGKRGLKRHDLMGALEELGYRNYWVRPHQLVPLSSSDFMPLFAVDLLAIKGDLPRLKRWRLGQSLTAEQQLRLFVQSVIGRSRAEQQLVWGLLGDAPTGFFDNPLAAALRGKLIADFGPLKESGQRIADAEAATPAQQPCRVLHITSWETTCGIATYAQNLVRHLGTQGVQCDVAPINRTETMWMTRSDFRKVLDKAIESARSADAVHVQHEFNLFAASGNLRLSLKHFRYLLAHLHRTGKPVVVTLHTEPFVPQKKSVRNISSLLKSIMSRRIWKHYVGPRLNSRRVQVLVHSEKSRLRMIQSGVKAEKIEVLPHAVPNPLARDLAVEKSVAKANLGLPEGCVLLSMFGFVSTYKGGAFAAGLLDRLPPYFHLALIGGAHPDDLDDRAIDNVIAASGRAGDRLHITGFASPELRDLYHCATDICLAPYLKKTNLSSSGAITWALSSGRPVIASKIPAFVELNRRYPCVALAAPEAPNEWVWNIHRIIGDEDFAAQLVTNALEYSVEVGWDKTAVRIANIYRSMIGKA
jgi:FkbM family methyltransferase